MTEKELRNKYVNTARSFFGAVQGDERHKIIIDTYNSYLPHPRGYAMTYTASWCAAFESACAIICDFTDIIPVECSCSEQIKLFQNLGRWEENDAYVPTTGDLLYYDWDDNGKGDDTNGPDHVGIVASCDGKTIRVIEGNKGDSHVVGYRYVNVNDRYIRGFAIPDFASKADGDVKPGYCTVEAKILQYGALGESVKTLQAILAMRAVSDLKIDGSFGPATRSAVKVFQENCGIEIDGSVGPVTWDKLING